ncbi:hypothetical protein LR48_Vigan442s008100 [Vigna angularis]|uniref:Uncharacterized protein n=1 Tax=Phaseolus angularis TaxID=3914 RepID=A0A0L9TAL0_PHAAN|nr:hypothetical protein LR48_Vigan442s008100 [Vigna angularis]
MKEIDTLTSPLPPSRPCPNHRPNSHPGRRVTASPDQSPRHCRASIQPPREEFVSFSTAHAPIQPPRPSLSRLSATEGESHLRRTCTGRRLHRSRPPWDSANTSIKLATGDDLRLLFF